MGVMGWTDFSVLAPEFDLAFSMIASQCAKEGSCPSCWVWALWVLKT